MTLRTVLLLVLAILAAGATALFARGWIAAQRPIAEGPGAAVTAPAPAVRVLVAGEPLPAGSFIKAERLKWQPWPEEGVAEDYVVDNQASPEDFAGAVARTAIAAGQPVTRALIVQPGDRGFLAAVLEPGKRAVSVPVNATTGISGFVFPGDWVDVILTVRLRAKGEGDEDETRFFSETLLGGVRVLAVDQTVENPEGQAALAKTATLEVTPKQAEKIALALEMGSLSLSLHSLAREHDLELDGTSPSAEKAVALADPDAPTEADESYTLDLDVYYMRDVLFGRSGGGSSKAKVNVLRGAEAETAAF